MNESNLKGKPEADVIFTELDNSEAVLLHLGTQAYYSLNATGAFIWQLFDKGLDVGQIGSELETRFEVSSEQARKVCPISPLNWRRKTSSLCTLREAHRESIARPGDRRSTGYMRRAAKLATLAGAGIGWIRKAKVALRRQTRCLMLAEDEQKPVGFCDLRFERLGRQPRSAIGVVRRTLGTRRVTRDSILRPVMFGKVHEVHVWAPSRRAEITGGADSTSQSPNCEVVVSRNFCRRSPRAISNRFRFWAN